MKEKIRLNIAVCDDEPAILEKLESVSRQILEADYDISVCTATSAEGITGAGMTFQLALLDVKMEKTDGISLARRILMDNPGCRIIFVSGFTSSVSAVYDVPHYCMVLKDQIAEQLPKFLHRAADEVAHDTGRTLQVISHKKAENLSLPQITFLERRGHVTVINLLSGQSLEVREKLTELMERIESPYFCRCHISYVVNLAYVSEAEGRYLKMVNGQQIPVSHTYEEETWKTYSRYLRRKF